MAYQFSNFLNRINMISAFDNHSVPVRRKKKYSKRFNPMMELTEYDFRYKYRFSKDNMRKLISLVREDLDGDRRGGRVSVDLQVMAAIRYWGRNEVRML